MVLWGTDVPMADMFGRALIIQFIRLSASSSAHCFNVIRQTVPSTAIVQAHFSVTCGTGEVPKMVTAYLE